METSGHNMAAASSEVSPGSRLQRRDRRGRPPSDGHGKLLFKDGSYYEGEFVHGEITGEGCRYWASSGNTYSGHFVLGEPQGHGMMKYKAGGYYEGELSHGMREGLGCLVDQDGQTYKGWFHNHRRHGRGQMTFQNGDKYEGDWVRDQRQGHGVLHQVDGSTYEVAGHLYSSSTCQCCSLPFSTLFSSQGQWHGDVFSGLGTLTHCSGVTYHGLWVNGHPVAQATRMVILGPEVLAVAPGAAFTLMVQLQQANGAVAEGEHGRMLRLSAGVRYVQLLAHAQVSFFAVDETHQEVPTQTPFGFECIPYPLWSPTSGSLEPGAALKRATSLPSLDDLETASVTWCAQGNPISSLPAGGQESYCLQYCQQAQHGHVQFEDVRLGPPPLWYHPIPFFSTPQQKTCNQPRGTTGDAVGGSRPSSMMASPGLVTAALPGEYVIMVHDVTTPPFLGHTLPTAFQHLRVTAQGGQSQPSQPPRGGPEAPGKGPDTSGKSSEPFGEGPDVPR
ncbi:MORN repeat-containing protein 1 isoform X2 [Erinaceus europaeus]|uniref:MORN repeat-containing protein 1 isoform X2 n=1 Tax=Erinaceus europaeus TaxID=9365 RepID=A0ABM3Y482_ERIEU|nr:MORN repeat-containing protein 1 isoform X2 [Erinaceus europaeus]